LPFFAVAFNIGNPHNKRKNTLGSAQKAAGLSNILIFIVLFISLSKKNPRRGHFFTPKTATSLHE
jgi:hypothetical protein